MESHFMSQARGRYEGSRRNGQRQPHPEKKSPPQRQKKAYVKAPPRDSTQTASIFKTRSFQFLVDVIGAENIAIALESNMTRVAELMKGERFTPETAFHMETTLGLPHGFFDQPNPALTDETIARLKSPLDFVQVNKGLGAEYDAPEPAPAGTVDEQQVPENRLFKEAHMPKKFADGSSKAVKNSRGAMPEQPEARAPLKASRSKDKTSPRSPQQQPLTLSESPDAENIRRANLRLLTNRNGSKVRLGVAMEMSGFNIADRLNGKKRMDGVEANRFTERLGLPVGWLDSPRTDAEIPEAVSRMLAPGPRGRTSVQQHKPLTPASNGGAQGNLAGGKLRTKRKPAAAVGDSEGPSPVSTDIVEHAKTIDFSPHAHVNDFPNDLAGEASGRNNGETTAATSAPSGSRSELLPDSSTARQNPDALCFISVTSLDNLDGIAPIAEALIKTLAGKARTGRLDELKALELLQQAVML
jgi:hypothetical protein